MKTMDLIGVSEQQLIDSQKIIDAKMKELLESENLEFMDALKKMLADNKDTQHIVPLAYFVGMYLGKIHMGMSLSDVFKTFNFTMKESIKNTTLVDDLKKDHKLEAN